MKLQFCARCYGLDHKSYECPALLAKETCKLCSDRHMGDLAVGHRRSSCFFSVYVSYNAVSRTVHFELDRDRREHIKRFVGQECFPEWTNDKRKSPGM